MAEVVGSEVFESYFGLLITMLIYDCFIFWHAFGNTPIVNNQNRST